MEAAVERRHRGRVHGVVAPFRVPSDEPRMALHRIPAAVALLRAAKEEQHPPGRTRVGEIDLFRAAGLPEAFRGVALWFGEQYRAHPPQIGLLHRLNERPDSELLAEAALFRSRAMEPGDPLERSPAVTLLLRWFVERYGAVSGIEGLFLGFTIMAGFIEQHLERLVELGFLESAGERHRLTGSLFLNNMPLTPSPRGGAEPFDFDAVVAMATACRDLTGDEAILAMRATLPPRPRPVAVGRNDPCPCGSGGKFKRCCGPRMN